MSARFALNRALMYSQGATLACVETCNGSVDSGATRAGRIRPAGRREPHRARPCQSHGEHARSDRAVARLAARVGDDGRAFRLGRCSASCGTGTKWNTSARSQRTCRPPLIAVPVRWRWPCRNRSWSRCSPTRSKSSGCVARRAPRWSAPSGVVERWGRGWLRGASTPPSVRARSCTVSRGTYWATTPPCGTSDERRQAGKIGRFS